MSSKPAASINIPQSRVTEVRARMQKLTTDLKSLGAESTNQSQLYVSMALGGEVFIDGNDIVVKFSVGSVKQ